MIIECKRGFRMILILAVKRRKNLLEETELSRRTDEPDAVLNKEE